MALHVAQMTAREAMRYCFECVTSHPAKIMGLEGYGVEVGCNADFNLLQARDTIEAIRLKATRLAVVRRGRIIAQTAPRVSRLLLDGRPPKINSADYAPTR